MGNQNYKVKIESFEDVISKKLDVCLMRSGTLEIELREKYPTASYIAKEDPQEIFNAVSNGECNIGVTDYTNFRSNKGNKKYNINCDLEWVGRRVTTNRASFAIKESTDLCTSFFRNTLDIFLVEMTQDGTLDDIWKKHEGSYSECNNDTSSKNSDKLKAKDMRGIFLVHSTIVAIATIYKFFEFKNTRVRSTVNRTITHASVIGERLRIGITGNTEEEISKGQEEILDDQEAFSNQQTSETTNVSDSIASLENKIEDSQEEMRSELKDLQTVIRDLQTEIRNSKTEIKVSQVNEI